MSDRIPVTIWGATGFAGAELLRIFARHPHFEVIGAVFALEGRHVCRRGASASAPRI